MKATSVPTLELMVAVLGLRLLRKVSELAVAVAVAVASVILIVFSLQSFVKIKITTKTGLEDCRVGIKCFKCAVGFLLKSAFL